MVKQLPHRPISGGTAGGVRPARFNYWRTGYGERIFPNLDFYVVQAGEYHCKPNYTTGNFDHSGHTQFFYHLSGEAIFEYSGKRILASGGDVFIAPPRRPFTYTSRREMQYHWFSLAGNWPAFLGTPEIQTLSLGGDRDIEALFVEIREILILRKIGYPLRAIGVFYELMARIEEISGNSAAPESTYPEAVRNAIIYLRENYAVPFNTAATADAVGLSPSHLRALFEKWLGESPKRFHTRTRIKQAQRLFREQNLPVSEVASHVGFSDVHHFSRVFKQFTGLAPSRYAEQQHQPDKNQ